MAESLSSEGNADVAPANSDAGSQGTTAKSPTNNDAGLQGTVNSCHGKVESISQMSNDILNYFVFLISGVDAEDLSSQNAITDSEFRRPDRSGYGASDYVSDIYKNSLHDFKNLLPYNSIEPEKAGQLLSSPDEIIHYVENIQEIFKVEEASCLLISIYFSFISISRCSRKWISLHSLRR